MKVKSEFLTKQEELELGWIIQEHFKAKAALEQEALHTKAKVLQDLGEDLPEDLEVALREGAELPEEEREALTAAVVRGEEAVDKLVRANLGLVHERALAFKNSYPAGPDYEDLVQEGMTGLMTAVKKYDPSMNNKFSTVAFYWISQAVSRGANKTGRMVRLPENRIHDYLKINRVVNKAPRDATPDQVDKAILEEVGISKVDLMNIRAAAATHSSLNKVVSKDGSHKELIDFIADETATCSSEEAVVRSQLLTILTEAVESLSPVTQEVLRASYSFTTGEQPLTPKGVKEKYNLPDFRYKKLQTEGVRALKEALTGRGLTFQDFC